MPHRGVRPAGPAQLGTSPMHVASPQSGGHTRLRSAARFDIPFGGLKHRLDWLSQTPIGHEAAFPPEVVGPVSAPRRPLPVSPSKRLRRLPTWGMTDTPRASVTRVGPEGPPTQTTPREARHARSGGAANQARAAVGRLRARIEQPRHRARAASPPPRWCRVGALVP
jgi:hypothetical protein